MFSNTSNLTRVSTWEQAVVAFNEAKKPRRRVWEPNERPLNSASQHHYRLVRNDSFHESEVSYSVWLYEQEMARFFRPDANGDREVWYNGHLSRTSSSFGWDVLALNIKCHLFQTVHGNTVYVPIYPRKNPAVTRLVFTKERRLIPERSVTAGIERISGNPEVTKFRRDLRKQLKWLSDVLELCTPQSATIRRRRSFYTTISGGLDAFSRDALAGSDLIDRLTNRYDQMYWNASGDVKKATTAWLREIETAISTEHRPNAYVYTRVEGMFHDTMPTRWRFTRPSEDSV